MSSQCKGTTKTGSPCKITIVLPNGYCRVHQEQYVAEIKEDMEEIETSSITAEKEYIKESVPEGKREKAVAKYFNSTSYVGNSRGSKRWYVVPVLMMAILWIISQLMRKKQNIT